VIFAYPAAIFATNAWRALLTRVLGLFFPVKIRAHVGASLTAGLADEPRFQIREPEMIRPLVRANRNRVAAMIVRAINQEAADAGRSHFPEGDFLLTCRRG
jgi:hypothetical protein